MPDPANVFNGNQPPADPPHGDPNNQPAPNTPNLDDMLKNIKNENGEQKYKTLADALTALDHSQKYIPELKNQLAGTLSQLEEMKGKVEKFSNVEETVQRLLAQQQPPQRNTDPPSVGLDEQAVLKLVTDSMSKAEQMKAMESNQKTVNDALVGKFGDKAIEVLETKAKELNTTRQALGELAKSNPKLVLALFDAPSNQKPTPTLPSRRTPDPVSKPNNDKPAKSLLAGVSAKQQAEALAKIRQEVFEKHGIDN